MGGAVLFKSNFPILLLKNIVQHNLLILLNIQILFKCFSIFGLFNELQVKIISEFEQCDVVRLVYMHW